MEPYILEKPEAIDPGILEAWNPETVKTRNPLVLNKS
jgi:hypothetical protein